MAGGTDHRAKERARVTATVPAVSGDYANERIEFGDVGSGQYGQSFMGVTALIEQIPASARVELWLPKVADASLNAADRTDSDFFYAGLVLVPARVAYTATGETASYGSASWPLCGYPGAQLRIRSGGIGGSAVISATAD
jgi:hypothetical protein